MTPIGCAPGRRRDGGQAAVELALAIPIVVLIALGVVQVALVIADRLAVELAAREGARAAAVAADPAAAASAAAAAATSLTPVHTETVVSGDRVRVTVAYTDATDVPLVGMLLGDVSVRATVTMQREPP